MRDTFNFKVSYTVKACHMCPHFRECYDDSPYCTHIFANGMISYKLNNDYTESIHEDCPMRGEKMP